MLDSGPPRRFANGHCARPGGVRVFAFSRRVSPGLTRPRRGGRIKDPERCQCGGLFVLVRPCAIPRVVTPRGLDLSGTLDGAGGIGGLLARSRHATSSPYAVNGNSFYHADGNGNVTYLASSSDGTDAAYRYDPFGRWLAQTGPYASANVMRFSSKPWVAHNGSNTDGLYYYGYRFYDPLTQRWPNRDPIGELGGANLYGFVYNNPVNRFDRLGLDANTPSSTITPWELGWEWLTGNGPRHRDFGPGDYMTEGLRQHWHIKDSIDKMKTEIFFRCQSCKNGDFTKSYLYSLAGWEGIPKYLYDYSTLATGGNTGNLVVTYLGSYGLDITASDIKCSKGTAKLSFLVNNSSTAASGTRPPVLGYTEWWQNNIAPYINQWFQNGGMSTTTQTFRWTENVSFDANHCCVD